MKKFLVALLALLIVLSCAAIAEVKVDPDLFPVVPNGKEVIQNPNTYCNPIALTKGNGRISRFGEPIIRVFQDEYYLTVSGTQGYWVSPDFVDWTFYSSTGMVTGINGWVEIDGELYSYAGNGTSKVSKTADPKSGVWTEVGQLSAYHNNGDPTGGYGDASMLYDDETGRLYMYYGWSQILGIRCVEIDKTTWNEIGDFVVCVWGDPHTHGWETRYSKDMIYPYFSHREYRPEEYGWTEGGHPLKYHGKFYLMYASIGLEFYSYGHGVYVADDPMGPWNYELDNPLTMKTTGIAPGAGHGSIWVDRLDQVWTICMVGVANNGAGGPTMGNLFPSGVDADGVMYGIEEYGDFPQWLPEVTDDPFGHFTGWVLLTLDKETTASSYVDPYYPAYVVDEDAKTFWCAKTGDAGEYITVDMGDICDIRAIQIIFDKKDTSGGSGALDLYHCYTVEASDDGETWTLIIDKSVNSQDLQADYIELPAPVYARYLKLTNVNTPDNGKFAVKGFRAFGNPDKATFTILDDSQVKVVRSELDRRNAFLVWDEIPGADGYVVRYGTAADKLYNSYMTFWDTYLQIPSLNTEADYVFQVEAWSSGTPRFAENTFKTRGRGAELDFTRKVVVADPTEEDPNHTKTVSTTDRIMTFETYGVDETYVFDNIVPGNYRLAHTFGVGIWGAEDLTAEQLIGGDPTVPTVVAENLTQFGNNNTKWGEISVYVYPGETAGRLEVVFHYTIDE